MKADKEVLKMLAESGDIVNTLNGGMSLAKVKMHTLKDHYLVTVRVPGLNQDALKLEMQDGDLFVYQRLEADNGLAVPFMIASISVTDDVNRHAITTNYHGNRLNIVMPIDPLSDMD